MRIGDRVLLKNVSEGGGTGKLRSFQEQTVYKIKEKKQDIPVYVIVPEKGKGKPKTVHKNLLMKCQHLLHDLNHESPSPSKIVPRHKLVAKIKEKEMKLSSVENIPELIDESDSETEIEVTPNIITTLTQNNTGLPRLVKGQGIDTENIKEPLITNDRWTDVESPKPNSMRVVTSDQQVPRNRIENQVT